MRKVITVLLIALSFATTGVSAENEVINKGTVITINADGTGTLRDVSTGEIKLFISARTQRIAVGTEVSYVTIQDESKGFNSLIR